MKRRKGQSAIEYLILATVITIIVLIGFDQERGFLIEARNLSEEMFNRSVRRIVGISPLTSDAIRTTMTNYP
ncbi:MAG: hypothetical protein AB1650_01775 [Candidatus Omnitrophota bacterium]